MALIYDGDFTVASAISPRVKEFPFERDIESYMVRQRFMQRIDRYARLPLNTPDVIYPTAYLVEEAPMQEVDGGIGTFERLYSVIPKSRVDYESYSFTYPGIGAGGGVGAMVKYSVTAISAGGSLTKTFTIGSHSITAGEMVRLTVLYPSTNGPYLQPWLPGQYSQYRQAWPFDGRGNGISLIVSSVTGTTITITFPAARIHPFVRAASVTGQTWHVYLITAARPEISRVTMSRVATDFFLPGVSPGINTPEDIPIISAPKIYRLGVEVNSYFSNSSPTYAEYRDMIKNNEWIVAEDSIILPWRGNIYMRQTRYVPVK